MKFLMISFEKALDNILSRIQPLGLEKVVLLESLGKIIGEDIYAKRDIPPLDNSAMDGYAVKFEDVRESSKDHPTRLTVIEDLPAGSVSKKTVGKGQAIRIMTGAPIPKGADTVVPVEETKKEDGSAFILKGTSSGENIRRAGEDVKEGDRVISKGDMIRPAEVGMLASVGRSSVLVYQKPLVAILCTGDELVDIDENLGESKIISSNSYTLAAQVKDCGADPVQLGIARDRKEEIREKLRQGIRADVIISSAGVSVGDYDFSKDALGDLGMEMAFWQVSMKPGKPLAFGTIQGKPVFGLPGNPVSSMVSFEEFVRPSLLKMMGHRQIFRPVVEAVLQEEIKKTAGRRHFIRAFISFKEGSYFATTTGDQGSGILMSMLKANGLIMIPEEQEFARVGEKVRVQLLDAPFKSPG
ncbi:MAG TPA: gephyrin-like molybdotransferase Glp [Thermodesulfobacteriota bacterium]|nr:gephyrin-like molybdotransferase Glp [Thermodesulfobacteriota bacterium]